MSGASKRGAPLVAVSGDLGHLVLRVSEWADGGRTWALFPEGRTAGAPLMSGFDDGRALAGQLRAVADRIDTLQSAAQARAMQDCEASHG